MDIKSLIKVLDDIENDEKKDNEQDKIKQINIASIGNNDTVYSIQRNLIPQMNYKSNFLTLNTKYRVLDNNPYKLSWNYLNNAQYQQGTINTLGKLHHIIGIRLYEISFEQNFYSFGFNNLTSFMLIDEFKSQSIIAHENINFHFMLRFAILNDALTNNDSFVFTPMNDGYFWFRKPYTEISSFTISFYNSLNPVPVPLFYNYLPMNYVTFGTTTTIYIISPIPFTTNDTVVISGFTTNDPVTDASVIAEINNPNGYQITVNVPLSSIIIPVDSSSIHSTVDPTKYFNIVNESNGIIISMEIFYIESESSEIDI